MSGSGGLLEALRYAHRKKAHQGTQIIMYRHIIKQAYINTEITIQPKDHLVNHATVNLLTSNIEPFCIGQKSPLTTISEFNGVPLL